MIDSVRDRNAKFMQCLTQQQVSQLEQIETMNTMQPSASENDTFLSRVSYLETVEVISDRVQKPPGSTSNKIAVVILLFFPLSTRSVPASAL